MVRDWNDRLKTSTYLEYKSQGPGVNGGHRVVVYPPLTKEQERQFNPRALLSGNDHWDPVAEANALRKLVNRSK